VVVAGSTCLAEVARSTHMVLTEALAEAMDLDSNPVEDRNNHLDLEEEDNFGTASPLAHCMDRHHGGQEEARRRLAADLPEVCILDSTC